MCKHAWNKLTGRTAQRDAQRQADAARAREDARQVEVDKGAAHIREVFSKFNDGYYKGIERDYTNYQTPMVNQRFADFARAMKVAISNRGLRGSTIAAQDRASLDRQLSDANREVALGASDYAARHKGNVADIFSSLLSQNAALGDADIAFNNARTRAESLTPERPQPLVDIFARGSQLLAHQANLERQTANDPFGRKFNRTSVFGLDKKPSVSY